MRMGASSGWSRDCKQQKILYCLCVFFFDNERIACITVVRRSEENLECYKGLSFAVCQPDGGIYREDRMAPGFDGSLWEMDLPDGNGASGISSAVFC